MFCPRRLIACGRKFGYADLVLSAVTWHSGFGSVAASVAGWRYPPQEEVPVSSSCFSKGLLIVENAG